MFIAEDDIILKEFKPVLLELFAELDARALAFGVDVRSLEMPVLGEMDRTWMTSMGVRRKLSEELAGIARLTNSSRKLSGEFSRIPQEEIDNLLSVEAMDPVTASFCSGIFEELKKCVVHVPEFCQSLTERISDGSFRLESRFPFSGYEGIPRTVSGFSLHYLFSAQPALANIKVYDSYREPRTLLRSFSVRFNTEYSSGDLAFDQFGGLPGTKYRIDVEDIGLSQYDSAYIDVLLDGTSQIVANGGTVPLPPIEQ